MLLLWLAKLKSDFDHGFVKPRLKAVYKIDSTIASIKRTTALILSNHSDVWITTENDESGNSFNDRKKWTLCAKICHNKQKYKFALYPNAKFKSYLDTLHCNLYKHVIYSFRLIFDSLYLFNIKSLQLQVYYCVFLHNLSNVSKAFMISLQ